MKRRRKQKQTRQRERKRTRQHKRKSGSWEKKKKKRKHGKREIEQYRGKDKLNTKRVYIYGDRDGKPETDRSFCAL